MKYWVFFLGMIIYSISGAVRADGFINRNQWQGVVVYSNFLMGSGVPISKCHVITNHHVIRTSNDAGILIDGEQYFAKVIDKDTYNDLALLAVDGCPILKYASVANVPPEEGETLTSVYYKPGLNLLNRMIKTQGKFKWYSDIDSNQGRSMRSMVIDDPRPGLRSSGGGVSSKNGLVSIIFGISTIRFKPHTYAVNYTALKSFVDRNWAKIRNTKMHSYAKLEYH